MARITGWWLRLACIPLGGLLVYAAWIGTQFLTADPRNTTFLDLFLDPHSGLYTVWALYLWLAGSVFVAPLWALGRRVGLWVIPTVMVVAVLFLPCCARLRYGVLRARGFQRLGIIVYNRYVWMLPVGA